MSTRLANFASALLGALTVAVVVVALALAGVFDDDDPAPAAAPAASAPAQTGRAVPAATGTTNVADVYARSRPGVVDIQVTQTGAAAGTPDLPFDLPPGSTPQPAPTATGSGFVLDREGYVLTNQHVIGDARTAEVRFDGEEDTVRARVVGTDPSTDLALLKVDPEQVERLTPLPLGDNERLRVGEPTIALGSPFGLAGTLTTGVVSALDRPIEAPNRFTIEGAIQTDAAINPGNSGGPLLDAQGRVIGINAQIRTDGDRQNSGVGFAIPIDTAKDVVPELKRNGEVRRPYLGVSTGDAPGDTGVLVASVAPGDPADDAGLREGDVIVRVGDKATNAPADVAAAIADRKVGEEVEVTYRRGEGDERTATVRLAERPQEVRTG